MILFGTLIGKTATNILSETVSGTIIGVFHHGWYLDCDGRILLIHDEDYGTVPIGIGIQSLSQLYPLMKKFDGSRFYTVGKTILIDDIVIDASKASTVVADAGKELRRANTEKLITYAEEIVQHRYKGEVYPLLALRQYLLAGEVPEDYIINSTFTVPMVKATAGFFASLNSNGLGMEESLKAMIGLGVGLTPSMDDWLNGFLYTALRMPLNADSGNLISQICYLFLNSKLLERTNRISGAYIKASCQGDSVYLFDKVLYQMFSESRTDIIDIGSSSGLDTLIGMAFACYYFADKCDNHFDI